ncbi:hypothetical protein ACOSP7_014954 [Xanthoceras sorbifolium]
MTNFMEIGDIAYGDIIGAKGTLVFYKGKPPKVRCLGFVSTLLQEKVPRSSHYDSDKNEEMESNFRWNRILVTTMLI